jgi:triphosphoribosyl-dephospho-CoA synthetase
VTEEKLLQLDEAMVKNRWSPGGCADLLSVCYLLHFLQEEKE